MRSFVLLVAFAASLAGCSDSSRPAEAEEQIRVPHTGFTAVEDNEVKYRLWTKRMVPPEHAKEFVGVADQCFASSLTVYSTAPGSRQRTFESCVRERMTGALEGIEIVPLDTYV